MNNNKYLEIFDIETLKRIYQMKIIKDYTIQQYEKYMDIKNITNKENIINKFDDIPLKEFKELIKLIINSNDSDNKNIIDQLLNLFNEI